jgi:hypothetical protein
MTIPYLERTSPPRRDQAGGNAGAGFEATGLWCILVGAGLAPVCHPFRGDGDGIEELVLVEPSVALHDAMVEEGDDGEPTAEESCAASGSGMIWASARLSW